MPRYIDADDALKLQIDDNTGNHFALGWNRAIAKVATDLPTADVAPVVHAHWKRLDYPKRMLDWYRCTNCGRERVRSYDDPHSIYELLPYCNCGAKMEEEVKDDAEIH